MTPLNKPNIKAHRVPSSKSRQKRRAGKREIWNDGVKKEKEKKRGK